YGLTYEITPESCGKNKGCALVLVANPRRVGNSDSRFAANQSQDAVKSPPSCLLIADSLTVTRPISGGPALAAKYPGHQNREGVKDEHRRGEQEHVRHVIG